MEVIKQKFFKFSRTGQRIMKNDDFDLKNCYIVAFACTIVFTKFQP